MTGGGGGGVSTHTYTHTHTNCDLQSDREIQKKDGMGCKTKDMGQETFNN